MNYNATGQQQVMEGSRTISIEEITPVLQLRAADEGEAQQQRRSARSQRPRVRWETDVVDNEHMNKKKTKICCIFHPQQEFSDEEPECHSDHDHSSSSSSSSESEGEKDLSIGERRQRRVARRKRKLNQNTKTSPNAYEVQPDYTHHHDKCNKQLHNH